jgi:pyruvate/2-oxoglutarate dehydrogenase complex dihydrolipoamide acyltransferase (E2) component
MKVTLKLPMFGMNMDEATIVRWHVAPGQSFAKGAALYEVETEKVTTDVAAPCDGTLLAVLVPEGSDATAGTAVCSIDATGG